MSTRSQRFDDFDKATIDTIMEYGWAVQGVFPTVDDPGIPFHYTIGLSWKGLPELFIAGLGMKQGQGVLNTAARKHVERPYQAGDVAGDVLEGGFEIRFIEVKDDSQHPLSMAHRMFRVHNSTGRREVDTTSRVDALQLLFQDTEHRWPWEPGFAYPQLPILGDLPEGVS